MDQCSGCGRDVSEEFLSTPRLPCPFCGAFGRIFSCEVHETIKVTDSVSWVQTRPVKEGSASLDSAGNIGLTLTGRPPKNEEGSLAVSARLVRRLNANGANWNDPVPGIGDVDALSTDRSRPAKKLLMQVVRAAVDEGLWQQLACKGSAEKNHDLPSAAEELLAAIQKKAAKYPETQRKFLNLILDASRTPNYTFTDVHDLFAKNHRNECRGFGFASVWVVGAADALSARLDL